MSDEVSAPLTLPPLSFEQARVLGCLIEKEMATPENYPLTLNSLVSACNQTTNREPVVGFDEGTVMTALEVLKTRGFAFQVTIPGARVQKFKHNLGGKFPRLEKPGMALMCVLLLRGAQTAGELRQRTERLHGFLDIPSLEAALQELISYPETPLVTLIPAGAGRKAITYAQLLCGPVEQSAVAAAPLPVSSRIAEDAGWKDRIEQELAELRAEVSRLRRLVEGGDSSNGSAAIEPPSQGEGGTYIP